MQTKNKIEDILRWYKFTNWVHIDNAVNEILKAMLNADQD